MQNVDLGATYNNINIDNELGLPSNGGNLNSGGAGTTVPPSTANMDGMFNLYLTCGEAAQFFDGNNLVGIGNSKLITYSPLTSFGSEGTYTAKIDNQIAKNYFVVFLNREQRGYNQQTNQQTYYESIRASEYRLKPGSETEYEFYQYKNLGGVTGTMELNFLFQRPAVKDDPKVIIPSKTYDFTISVDSNYLSDLGDVFSFDYKITNTGGGDIITGKIPLKNKNTNKLSLSEDIINSSDIFLTLSGDLPKYFIFKSIKIGNDEYIDRNIKISSSIIKSGNINAILNFDKKIPQPIVSTTNTQYNVEIKDSDSDKIVNIPFKGMDFTSINVTFPNGNVKNIDSSKNSFDISFKKDFAGIGINDLQKLILTPLSDTIVGTSIEVFVLFKRINDTPSITDVSYPTIIDIPSFSDYNIEYNVVYNTLSATSVKVELLQSDNTKVIYLDKLTPNGSFKVNLKNLKNTFENWSGDITFIFTAINNGGDVSLESNTYTYTTKVTYPTIVLDENIINKSIYDAFANQINIYDLEKESKYLTHLTNFGNDSEFLISSWDVDNWTLSKKSTDELGNEIVKPEDVVESLILKLYKPLSPNITTNSTLWITKLLTNPLIETIVLNQQDNLKCPPLKGPNFSIEVDFVTGKSTGYESLDDLIFSGSTSSGELVQKYLSGSFTDVDNLNIEYYTIGSTDYNWSNFVHFSSAKERVDNFVYKVRLIELYEGLIVSASTDVNNIGFINSVSSQQEVERQMIKKNQIIQSFDGFETFLYVSSSYTTNDNTSITWPYNGNNRLSSNDNYVINWYNNLAILAADYDGQSKNWINNNIPQYIVNNNDNASLLLFFSMIGHHFDNIYFHTKAIEKSRGFGYKQTGNISDKLLFDILKSYNWDAKNLASDNHLWNLVFGVDSEGNSVNDNPAKKRNFEVWRRIANNLPHLLKHKGTRQGIYALLACYGIPSSNLSILEFGGPEVTDEQKGKLVIDNITTALKFTSGSKINMDWKHTNKMLVPNTVELFIKPTYISGSTILSGSGWNVQLIGSTNNEYGKVIFNYSGSTNITSPLLPIFNGRFFGISVSSGSNGLKLDLRQSEKERTIFEYSQIITGSVSNWNTTGSLQIGGNYIGSVDEFRLWSEQLNTDVFYEHVSFPEMVNGNSISASVDDLYFRLDFEYPKNLYPSASMINVDTNVYYPSIYLPISSQSLQLTRNHLETTSSIEGVSLYSLSENTTPLLYASANGFVSSTSYPYQFEPIDRTIVMAYPDGGANRFQTSKVRFESQTLISDLSVKHRSTKKAFDQSPADSNRVGLFFSPTKELNIDIAKSFGGLNIDNYIGDPSDDYKPTYSELDSLRHYYFQRIDGRNIYEYINLIKLYEKSMFEDIKKMLPARVKATTGLLIEPHFLERSKIAHKKPTGDDYQLDTEIHYNDTTIVTSENEQYETIVNANLSENLLAENYQYQATVYTASVEKTIAENYQQNALINENTVTILTSENYQYDVDINAQFAATLQSEIDVYSMTTVAGQSPYEEIGFGLYGDNGYAIRTYIDTDGTTKKERIKVDLIKTQKTRNIVAPLVKINGQGDPRGGYYVTSSIYYETKLNIQPFSGSKVINAGTGSIVEVKPLAGYLPTHYKNTSDLTTGLKNSYYLGSKNTAATTLDGTSPIETFISNPNTLKVNPAGRPVNEPILDVE